MLKFVIQKDCAEMRINMEQPIFTREDLKKLIIPLIIEQMLALSIGLFDTLMVSSCGEASVSGVSLVDSISVLLIQILSALATGGGRCVQPVSRQKDAGESKTFCGTADVYHAHIIRNSNDSGIIFTSFFIAYNFRTD